MLHSGLALGDVRKFPIALAECFLGDRLGGPEISVRFHENRRLSMPEEFPYR